MAQPTKKSLFTKTAFAPGINHRIGLSPRRAQVKMEFDWLKHPEQFDHKLKHKFAQKLVKKVVTVVFTDFFCFFKKAAKYLSFVSKVSC